MPDEKPPAEPRPSREDDPPATPRLQPLVISAPFGNYIQPVGTTPTLGTFTRQRRPGRLWRVLRTLRYDFQQHAWVNKLGLRNPGIDWLVARVQAGRIDVRDKLVSIHGFTDDDWQALLERVAALKPLAVELNMSCPNVGELDCPQELFTWAVDAMRDVGGGGGGGVGGGVVVKLPPVNYEALAEQALAQGVRAFHCCNTIPVPAGGMSGPPVKPLALACIRWLREQPTGDQLTLIAGGGIRQPSDIDDYAAAGANHFALGTRVMNPVYLVSHRRIKPLIAHARQRLG